MDKQRQLENMKRFLIQEAREKEAEVRLQAEEAYDAEKQRLEREGREQVEREFERKMKAAESRKRMFVYYV
jgi:vacuolar-type H+-ATPase subunit H